MNLLLSSFTFHVIFDILIYDDPGHDFYIIYDLDVPADPHENDFPSFHKKLSSFLLAFSHTGAAVKENPRIQKNQLDKKAQASTIKGGRAVMKEKLKEIRFKELLSFALFY